MTDAPRRGIRTVLQGLLALVLGIPATAAAFGVDAATAGKIGAVCALVTGVVTVVMNELEDRDIIPALLKAPASDGANPIPD